MKKIFAGFAFVVLFLATGALFAAEVAQPRLPDSEGFITISSFDCENSVVNKLVYTETDTGVQWAKYYVAGKAGPFAVSKINSDSNDEYWVDKNSDDFFEEHYSSFEEVSAVYPGPCAILKK